MTHGMIRLLGYSAPVDLVVDQPDGAVMLDHAVCGVRFRGVRVRYRDPLGDWCVTDVGEFDTFGDDWVIFQVEWPTTAEAAQAIGRTWLAERTSPDAAD